MAVIHTNLEGVAILTHAHTFTRVTTVSNHQRVSLLFSSSYFFLLYIGDFYVCGCTTIYLYVSNMRNRFWPKPFSYCCGRELPEVWRISSSIAVHRVATTLCLAQESESALVVCDIFYGSGVSYAVCITSDRDHSILLSRTYIVKRKDRIICVLYVPKTKRRQRKKRKENCGHHVSFVEWRVMRHQQNPAEITSAYKRLSAPAIVAIHASKTQIASAYHTLPFDESEV